MIERADIPDAAKCCPECGYDLRGTIRLDLKNCPECAHRFSKRDLYVLFSRPDPGGEPFSISPHEWRIPGRWLIWALVAVIVVLVLLTVFSGQLTSGVKR